jgi:hypothetical protein
MSILVTIQSENRRNLPATRVDGLDPARIIDYYANPDLTGTPVINGNTIVVYDNSPGGYGQLTILYGITETTAYIAAGGQTSANTIFTIKKTIGWSGATGVDFNLPSAANANANNIDLGAIIPANARILDGKIVNTAASVFSGGATTLVAGLGNATSGAQISASATIYAVGVIAGNMACINTPIACSATASHVWVSDITPGANWSTQTAGTYSVYITYNDASAL